VLDTSGYSHRIVETDIYDSHDYTQDPAKFAKRHATMSDSSVWRNETAHIASVPIAASRIL